MYSIDNISIATFNKVQETGELKHLCPFWLPKWLLARLWATLMDQYIREIGISDSLLTHYRQMKQYVSALVKSLDRPSYRTNALHFLNEAKTSLPKNHSVDVYEVCAALSKVQGYHINPRKISVKEFYALLKSMKDGK